MPDIFDSKKSTKQDLYTLHKGKDPRVHAKLHSHKRPSHKRIKADHRHNHNPLSAFSYYPDKVKFVGADDKEKIVLLLRQHPIVNVRWIIVATFMVFLPLIVTFLPAITLVPVRFQVVGILAWYLITSAFILEEFLSWFFNVYIITDERVFDVDFVHLTYREITDANIDQIQDVTTKLGGVFGTLVNYGHVFIQTASAKPQIEFLNVPNPDGVAEVLRDLRVEEEQEKVEGRVR